MKARMALRTLVIDDDPAICRQLRISLAYRQIEVETFNDPRAALSFAVRNHCDLAFVDLIMPDTDASVLIADLARLSPLTAIVAMSAFPEPATVRAAVRAGARDLLEKPIDQRRLLRLLERQLQTMGVGALAEREFNVKLGQRLRTLRKAAGLTQNQLSDRVGLTAAQLSQIERGRTATSTWTLARIAGALRVPLETVFAEV